MGNSSFHKGGTPAVDGTVSRPEHRRENDVYSFNRRGIDAHCEEVDNTPNIYLADVPIRRDDAVFRA